MSTTATITHSIEYPLSLCEDDPEDFARAVVRLHALQALGRLYPCTSKTDDLQVTLTTRRTTDPFGRVELTGIATALCSNPSACPGARGVILP